MIRVLLSLITLTLGSIMMYTMMIGIAKAITLTPFNLTVLILLALVYTYHTAQLYIIILNTKWRRKLNLTPAYGRDYTSKAKLLEDFNADKDFLLNTHIGRSLPINKSQITAESERTPVQFRYGKHRKTFTHTVERD